jgi:hypothetical protein
LLYPKVFRCHLPGDAASQWIVPVVGQCGMLMVDGAVFDSAANDQKDPATEYEFSFPTLNPEIQSKS